jgi:hypothetical protein
MLRTACHSLIIIYRASQALRLWSHGYQIRKHCCLELLHLVSCHPAGIKRQRPQVLQALQVFETHIGYPRV